MTSSTFYNDVEVRGVVKTLAGKSIGSVTTMSAANVKNKGCAVLYLGAEAAYTAGTIYVSDGEDWVAQGRIVTVDDTVTAGSDNPVSSGAVHTAVSNVQNMIRNAIVGTSLPVSWTSDTSVSGYTYKGTITLAGVTANHAPIVTFDPATANSGKYCPVAESGSGVVYIWSTTNTATTVQSVVAVPA